MSTIIIGALIGLIVFSTLYIFSTFNYEMSGNNLIIKWRLLKYIPFNSRRIDTNNIQSVKTFKFKEDILSPTDIWGNLFVKKGLIVILKEGFIRRIYITPDSPMTL